MTYADYDYDDDDDDDVFDKDYSDDEEEYGDDAFDYADNPCLNYGLSNIPYSAYFDVPTLDASYVNNWLPKEDEITDLSVGTLFLIKQVLEFYGKILSPGRKYRLEYSGQSSMNTFHKMGSLETIVTIPYAPIDAGDIDVAVGYTMREFRRIQNVEPGNLYYSSSWDVFLSFLKSIYVNNAGEKTSLYTIVESLMDDSKELSCKFVSCTRGHASSFFDSLSPTTRSTNSGLHGTAKVLGNFLHRCVTNIHALTTMFEDIRLDTTAHIGIRRYYQKQINKSWDSYQSVRGGMFKENSLAYKALEFKYFFYGKHNNTDATLGVNLTMIQKATARGLAKLAAITFQKDIVSAMMKDAVIMLDALEVEGKFPDASSSGSLEVVSDNLRKDETLTKKSRSDGASIRTTKNPMNGTVFESSEISYSFPVPSSPLIDRVFRANIPFDFSDNIYDDSGKDYASLDTYIREDCAYKKMNIPLASEEGLLNYFVNKGFKRYVLDTSINVLNTKVHIDYHVTVIDVL